MPTYTMTGPDGRVYKLEAGADIPKEKVEAELRRRIGAQLGEQSTPAVVAPADAAPVPVAAPTKQVKETALEKIPYVGKPLAFLADIPMGIMKGTGAGVEAIAGAAGAGTDIRKAIKDVQEMVDEYMSASSKEDAQKQSSILKEAEDKGILNQVAAGINAFAVAPIDTLTQAFGTAAAPIGATAAATYAGAPAAVVTGAGVVTGGLMGLGGTKNVIYDAVREEYIKAGVSEAKAEALADAAQAYSGENLGQILLGGTLGAISGVAGIEGALSKVVGQRVFGRLAAEKAGKEAAKSVGRRALGVAAKEGAPEFIQGAQEKLATNLALQREGFDVDTMRGVISSGTIEGIAGAGLGAGIGAVSGGVDGEVETGTNLANSPQVEQEFYRLVTAETQALRDQNPDLTQRQAYNQVVKDAGKLYDTAILNTMLGAEGATDVADVNTGVDDLGGTGTGTAPDFGTAPPAPSATGVGETIGGGLERPVSGVSVSDVGAGAGVGALDEAKNTLANKKIKLTERVDVARQLLNDTILNNKLVNDVDQKQYDAAKNQLANGKHNGDPMAALEAVTGKKFAAPPLPPATTVAAPTIEAAPSIDEVAVAPVADAIKSVATTTPDVGPIPTLAQTSAQQLGIAPTVETAPEIAATPDVAVQEDVQGYVDTRRQELAAQEAADAEAEATLRQEIEARKQQEGVAPAPVTEEIAPEVVAAPVEEAAPEADPYTDVLADIEAALADEAIDAKTHKLLTSAVERRLPLEKIEAQLDAARTRSAERAMGGGRFRPGEPGNITLDQVIPILEDTAERTGVPMPNIVQSVADLPPALQAAAISGSSLTPSGAIDADGNVYIIADNLTTVEEAVATLFHETLGHMGLAKQFRQRLDKVLRGMYDTNRNLRAETNAWREQNPDAYSEDADPIARAVEEILAQRSEAGRIEASLFAKLAAIIKDFARRMRIKAAFSDAEITTILAMAHDQAIMFRPGEREVLGGIVPQPPEREAPAPKVVSNGKQVVLTEAQKRTALAKAKAAREKMNRIQKRIASTNDTADVLSGGIDLVKLARGDKENLALLSGAIDAVDVGKWQLILPTLSTEDIFRILKGRIPGLIESDRITRQDIPRFQSKEYGLLAEELEQISEFLKKYPKAAQALSDLEFASVAYQVDPTKAATPEEYAKLDKKTKELQTELGSVTAGDAKGKKKVEDKIARRFADIKSVYVGVPGDERVLGWRDLGRPEFGGNKGKEIFKLIRDAHRRDLETKYNMLRNRLKETKKDKDLAEALEKLEAQFKPALEQVIYFPAMRFGSYYARVGTGANSVFKMFETRRKRNQFVRLMKVRGEEVTDIGNVEDLRNNFEQMAGGPLKGVLDLFGDNPKDIGALKSQVFDLWLQTMSAGDMRKHMAPRKMRAGYSTDILKNFATFRRSSINDVKRAKFGEQLRIEISRAKDMVKDMPDREKMEVFIKEIELRTMNSLTPEALGNSALNKMIELGNKAAFYQYLANPKTGVIQLTQLHIVALPILAQKYGHVNATAALAKYGFSALGGFATSPLTAIKKEDGSYTFNWEQPTLLDNPVTGMKEESDPELYEVLSEGWNEGRELNIFMDTFANEIGGFANADPQQSSAIQELMKGRVHTATWRGGVFVLDAMGSLMHQMERVNREATYMAALELAYRENKEKGQTHAEAKKNAIEAAVDTTLAATFDFSSYNKPRILTSPVGRVAGQFYSFPYMMSSLLIRNMYTAIKIGKLEPGERVAAIEIATGTLLNLFAYAGVKGVPLYGVTMGIASMVLWLASQFDDDDEEGGLSYIDKDGNIKATYNVDWWFRNVWIPKFFGKGGTVQNLFGYDDDTAATVALSMEKGPISAITDVDVANSVALDFMFFVPEEPRAKTPEGVAGELMLNFLGGATASTGIDYYKAIDDLMNGYTNRALEKTPKVFSNVAKANRFAEEGQLNYDRELVGMPEEFWTSDKVALQMLGFASTEASQRQEQNYEGRKITQKVKASRDETLAKFRKLALDKHQYGFTPEVAKAHKEFMKEWGEYNRTFPTDVISIDTLYEVESNAINAVLRSKATRGVPLDDKGKTPYMRDILKRRVEAEK